MFVCLAHNACGYTHEELNSAREKIKVRFIDQPTYEFIQARKKGKPMDEKFEEFLKKDPQIPH